MFFSKYLNMFLDKINMLSVDISTWHARLTAARRAKSFTKTALAPLVGVTPPAITGWENGNTKKIDGQHLMDVCRVLEITPEWLMHGEGQYGIEQVAPAKNGEPGAAETANLQSEMCNSMMLTEEETRLIFTLRKLSPNQRTTLNVVASSFLRGSE
jgi:transcriptional regulator with XRE-family HTH domain